MSNERVWDAINELTLKVDALREDFRTAVEQPKARHRGDERLTPEAVRGKRFITTRMRPGYVEAEVDSFLDQVEHEIATLIRERDGARAEADRLREAGE